MPPMEGLHDIWPRVSMLWVRSSVRLPILAAASAASVPAWPPPTTITSKRSGNNMFLNDNLRFAGFRHDNPKPDFAKETGRSVLFHVERWNGGTVSLQVSRGTKRKSDSHLGQHRRTRRRANHQLDGQFNDVRSAACQA